MTYDLRKSTIETYRHIDADAVDAALDIIRGDYDYGRHYSEAVDVWANLDEDVHRVLVRVWNDHAPVISGMPR